MKSLLQNIQNFVYKAFSNPAFFYVVVGLLIFQAVWIALTARYPQAFDENFHFGLIQLHAQQWLPWFSAQPAGADIYGAVARDPSYLYHYLFSFPYRLLELIGASQTTQIVILRLLNVGLFVAGLFVYRTLFEELHISRRLRNVILLFFVLIPVVPLLAGQINYDNLIFLLTGLLFVNLVRFWRAVKDTSHIPPDLVLKVLLYGAIGSIVKYAFAPLFLGAVVVLVVGAIKVWRARHSSARMKLFGAIKRSTIVLYTVLLLGVGVLFAERYGVNLVSYHTPVPDCAAVLSVDQCMSYSPWRRDHIYAQVYDKPSALGIFVYPAVWVHRTVYETMFTITSRFAADGTVDYFAVPPLTVANYTAWTIVTVGTILCLRYIKRLWQLEYLRILLLVTGFYVAVLFVKNFSMYLHTGEAVAIHGRYLIPVYPLLFLALALSFKWGLERFKKPAAYVWLVVITLLLFVHGAGLITWILRSHPDWYWPQSQPAAQVNHQAQNVLKPLIIEQIP